MIANSPSKSRTSSVSSYSGPTQPIPKKSLQIRTDKPRPHVCAICTRGFARLEHLKRHERSHTNEKPFQCAACGRCFARRDLVLRHQQKLHSQVGRRSSLPNVPTSAPGAMNGQAGAGSESATSTPSNEHIIVLQNNTDAKAPLPDSRASSPSGLHVSNSANSSPARNIGASPSPANNVSFRSASFAYGNYDNANGASKHNMPSPNTNSSLNTPLANLGTTTQLQLRRASHAVDPAQPNITQQPSPVTGDSPDLKDKKANMNWGDDIGKMNYKQFSHLQHLEQQHQSQYRHTSFSAVSGASYTNLKDALAIQSHQIPDVPQQVGFSTPQHTIAEMDSKGLSTAEYGNFADWYGDNSDKGDFMDLADELSLPQHSYPSRSNSASSNQPSAGRQGFQSRLNTIPSESQLAGNNDMLDMAFYSNQIHQFNSPSHPHYIKDNTLLNLGVPTNLEGSQDFLSLPTSDTPLDTQAQSTANVPSQTLASQMTNSQDANNSTAGTTKPKPRTSRQPSIKKHKSSSVSLDKEFKRAKLGFVNDTENLDWVNEIMAVPVASEFPKASHDTGFMGMPYLNADRSPDEVLTLFKHRQDDLVKQRSLVNTADAIDTPGRRPSQPLSRQPSKVQFTIGDGHQSSCVTKELRNRIVTISNMSDSQFPPLEDLNTYMSLYESEFNIYFPFIHMPSLRNPMVDNYENIPLILSMCAIGALYSYHDSNTLLLFNLSKFHIHNFFEKEVTADKLNQRKVPLMAHQSLVLHIFISMFLNEPNMLEITTKQMNSMVGLIRSTNFHRPLDQFLIPPPPIKNETELGIIQNNYDYFIMAQTRIRTILCFYELEVVRSCLLGSSMPMSGAEILSGTPCRDEKLYTADNSRDWYYQYRKADNKDLVSITNNEGLNDLFDKLKNQFPLDSLLPFNTLLVLLMYIHETISKEWKKYEGITSSFKWRTESKPMLERLISSWEVLFAKNGGFFKINKHNAHILNAHKDLQMILPLLQLAKMRLCVNITPVTEKVLHKDWSQMSTLLNDFENDPEALKTAASHATEILRVWTHNIESLNDSKQVSVRTPVFFVTCIFAAILVLQKALHALENQKTLSVQDRVFWLEAEALLTNIEKTLSPNEDSNSYSEFLRKSSQGVFDFVLSPSFRTNIESVIAHANMNEETQFDNAIGNCKLSVQALGLGVRILADAPLWPLAMGFAEAFKNVAIHLK
ncbi:hypothetical protein FT663_02105 [Candidozyma haemuli var. vulneris]|nr:hypothetical protein FT662_03263 [[Candida] haemuloni var. vulneris]KAF3992946.1 hypothetical protein FT663_02105 [[Candida] haemuloni var. vulneris]